MAKNAKATQAERRGTKSPKSNTKSKTPAPYAPAPASLAPFYDTLDPSHIYIVHVDRHPRAFKARIFAVPVLMNILFAASLVWRLRVILPWYYQLLLAVWGYDNELNVDLAGAGLWRINAALWGRALVFLLDFALARFVAPWPWDFFAKPGNNPTLWRTRVGFRDAEIAVRRSRKWDRDLSANWLSEEADGKVYAERIMPAVDRKWVRAKSAYMMLDKSWDLDWRGMITAHALVDPGTVKLQEFEKTVLVHTDEHGWLAWQLWKLDEPADDGGRQKIQAMRDNLKARGKEELFYRWIELLQFETSQPDGFTDERQAKAMRDTRELFSKHGVDFNDVWTEVGGGKGLPGM